MQTRKKMRANSYLKAIKQLDKARKKYIASRENINYLPSQLFVDPATANKVLFIDKRMSVSDFLSNHAATF